MSNTKMKDNIEKLTTDVGSLQVGQKELKTVVKSLQVGQKELKTTQDKIVHRLLSLEEKVDTMATSAELQEFRNDYNCGQDRVIKLLERHDQEIIFGTERTKRVEHRVNKVETILDIV